MINLLVFAALGAALIFVAIWAISPNLRTWIERPKHKFLDDVQRADTSKETEARR